LASFPTGGGLGTLGGMTAAKDAVGGYGERVAVRHLVERGLVLLDRNWRCPLGEVDVVMRDRGDVVAFIEVKTRRGDRFGTPAEAVGPAKVRRLRRIAAAWLAHRGIHPAEVRFDVVEVRPQRSGPAVVTHLAGAF
jgi:putative endonuclease